jgi:hypothetical protein
MIEFAPTNNQGDFIEKQSFKTLSSSSFVQEMISSAGLITLIVFAIALSTFIWYFLKFGLPMIEERRKDRNRIRKPPLELRLFQSPSTATTTIEEDYVGV